MNRVYTYLLMILSVVSLYSADKDMQQVSHAKTCPHIIAHEGTVAVHTDIYSKLLSISRTLQDQVDNSDTQAPLPNDPYHPVKRNIESLQYIVNYITADNSDTYLDTLSLIELVHLYQEADFWAINADKLDAIFNSLIAKLCNKDTLITLLSNKENLSTFITTCYEVTLDNLTRALCSNTNKFLWHTITRPTQTLISRKDGIHSVIADTDGTVFTGSFDGTIEVWETNAQGGYMHKQSLSGHTSLIKSLVVHTDGTLFSGSLYDTIRIWKKESGHTHYTCIQTLDTALISSLVILNNGILISSSWAGTTKVWKPTTGGQYVCTQTLAFDGDTGTSLAALATNTLFWGAQNGTIKVLKTNEQGRYECIQILKSHKGSISSLKALADGTLISGSHDGTIKVWKLNPHSQYICVQTLNQVWLHTVDADGTLFASPSSKLNTITVWKANAEGKYIYIQNLIEHTNAIVSLAILKDSVFAASVDKSAKVWKISHEYLLLEQCLLLYLLYSNYPLVGNHLLDELPAHINNIYLSLPQSVQRKVEQWRQFDTVNQQLPEQVTNIVNNNYIKKTLSYFVKPYIGLKAGIIAACAAVASYSYYKMLRG